MTPATRATLATYATRMNRSWSDVKRDFASLSQTERGRMIVEMDRVEALFQAQLDAAQARRDRLSRLFAPVRWVARRLGGGWGKVLRWVRR